MAPFDMEAFKDFVLKLKIKATDGTSEIRRVRLPRIADKEGNVSYEELAGLVVTFTFPDHSAEEENFKVSLTYFDSDEDTITIASNDELVDAIEQFAEKKVLRITTEVSPNTSPCPPPQATKEEPSRSNRVDRGTSTQEAQPPVKLEQVVEGFVGILATAVKSLEKGLAAAQQPAASKGTTSAKPTATASEEAPSPPSTAPDEPQEPPQPVPPFIHGRHTCDACLKTPIIGKRYHATNIQDYDLCANCHGNYGGSEIQFEPVELPRDRAFQKRWRRRHQKIEVNQGRSHRPAQDFGRVRRARPHNRDGKLRGVARAPAVAAAASQTDSNAFNGALKEAIRRSLEDAQSSGEVESPQPDAVEATDEAKVPEAQGEAHVYASPPCQHFTKNRVMRARPDNRDRKLRCVARYRAAAAAASQTDSNVFDGALKEAIQRSLEDAQSSGEVESPQPDAVEATDEVKDGALKKAIQRSLESLEDAQSSDEVESPQPDAIEATDEVKVPETQGEAHVYASPPCQHFTKNETSLDNVDISLASRNEEIVDEERFIEAMEETMSVDSEKMTSEDEESDKKPAAIEKPAVASRENSGSPKFEKKDSFTLDAIGNGDIAEQMGATLDIVAGVINEMLFEADSENTVPPQAGPQDIISDIILEAVKPQAKESETGEMEQDAGPSGGALILNPVDESDKKDGDGDEEGSWHVVNNESEGNGNEIGHAAQMLGSALFNSDMKGSIENISTLSHSDDSCSFSVPSTVPSISQGTEVSHVAPAQRHRWASQLEKLHELGFEDENLCVEILERLQAANIGVSSEDEVSVTEVVNAILEKK